jgi:hypothetical protein
MKQVSKHLQNLSLRCSGSGENVDFVVEDHDDWPYGDEFLLSNALNRNSSTFTVEISGEIEMSGSSSSLKFRSTS